MTMAIATPAPDTTTAAYEYRLPVEYRSPAANNSTTVHPWPRLRPPPPPQPVPGYRSEPGTRHASVPVRVVEREPQPRAVTPPAPRRPVRQPPSFSEPPRWRARFVSRRR